MGSLLSCLSTPEKIELRRARKEKKRLLKLQEAELKHAERLRRYHQEVTIEEDAKYKREQEKWQRQRNSKKSRQVSHKKRQIQRKIPLEQQRVQQRCANSQRPIIDSWAPSASVSAPNSRRLRLSGMRKVSPESEAKRNETFETFVAQLAKLNGPWAEWTDVDYVQELHRTSRYVAENVVKLLKDNNTIPFLACYRRDMTAGMDANLLRNIKSSIDAVKLIKQRANDIIKEVDRKEKWTPEFHLFVKDIKSLKDLERIRSMFEVKAATRAERAKDAILTPQANAVISGATIAPLLTLIKSKTEGLRTEQQVREGIVRIIADIISHERITFEEIQILRGKYSTTIETTRINDTDGEDKEPGGNGQKDEETKYRFYDNFSISESNLKAHQILEINRFESRKILRVEVKIPTQFEQDFKEYCSRCYRKACEASPLHRSLLTDAFDRVWNKSIKSFVCRRTRSELQERAEIALTNDFVENAKRLLLTPPVRGKVVVGVVSSFRQGCKLAVLSVHGDVLETETIYPHDVDKPGAKKEAEIILSRLVRAHGCTILALGNGTACRETEIFLAELIEKRAFAPFNVVYTFVDETAASFYSRSREATMEFPNLDVNVLCAISLARRLQDPIAELVKIEPAYLEMGMYKHNIPAKQLAAKLNEIMIEAVSFVGVDVNTAPLSRLRRVAGLSLTTAKNIIEWRKSSGPLRTRNDLKMVRGICSETFKQCAGFVRIMPETVVMDDDVAAQDSLDYLDQTSIHPEYYDIARAFVKAARCDDFQVGTKPFIFAVRLFGNPHLSREPDYGELAKKFSTNVETIEIIVEGLSMEKGHDMRGKPDESMFRKSSMSFNDLRVGMILNGIVRSNKDFGAFVDVGVEKDGLIHNQMGGFSLCVGQRVETKIHNIDKERVRLGLTLVKCF